MLLFATVRELMVGTGRIALLPPEEADARSEGTAVEGAEGQELGRSENVVYHVRILMVGDVVESAAQRPVEAESMKTRFQVRIQGEVPGVTMSSGWLQ